MRRDLGYLMGIHNETDRVAVRRDARKAGVFYVNGWIIERQVVTFATEFRWLATAVDVAGYQTAKRGFQRKRDAVAFAESEVAPLVRASVAMRISGAAKV